MSSSKSAEKNHESHHSVMMAWWRDKDGALYFLTGKESVYDKFVKFEKKMTEAEQEAYVRDVIKDDPDAQFSLGRSKSEHEPGYTIRKLKDKSTFGFPKGGSEPIDMGKPMNTAIREFYEEVGYKLVRTKVRFMGKTRYSYVYTYMVDDKVKKDIEDSIKTLRERRMGELFDVKFEKANDIERRLSSMNLKSADAFKYVREEFDVEFRGGSRISKKTRKHRQTRKRLRVKG